MGLRWFVINTMSQNWQEHPFQPQEELRGSCCQPRCVTELWRLLGRAGLLLAWWAPSGGHPAAVPPEEGAGSTRWLGPWVAAGLGGAAAQGPPEPGFGCRVVALPPAGALERGRWRRQSCRCCSAVSQAAAPPGGAGAARSSEPTLASSGSGAGSGAEAVREAAREAAAVRLPAGLPVVTRLAMDDTSSHQR